MRRHFIKTCFAAALATATFAAQAAYPDKPIHLICGYAPGGTASALSQLIAEELGKQLGQPVVVDHKPGANSGIAAEQAAKAPADGYTVFLVPSSTMGINPFIYDKINFDPVKDFKPVGQIATTQNVIVVHPGQPMQDVKGLIAFAKANPAKLTYGSSGVGSTLHLSGELFARMAGVKLVHAAYKGSGPARTDLLGGHIPLMFSDIGTMIPLIQSGKLRALAVTGAQRDPKLPNVPTVAEAGVPGYAVESWYGLAVPAATPDAVAQRLNAALVAVLQKAEVKAKLSELGSVGTRDASPAFLARTIDTEMKKWAPVVKEAGIKASD